VYVAEIHFASHFGYIPLTEFVGEVWVEVTDLFGLEVRLLSVT